MRTTSITQVAEHAGVSVGTVSNELNRPDVVAEPTRRRGQDAIATLGLRRNDNPFFTEVGRGAEAAVEAAAEAHGSMLTLDNTGGDPQRQTRHLEEQRVPGALITPVEAVDSRLSEVRLTASARRRAA